MSIAFAFRQNVQIVTVPGPISPEEDAAIRLKLDQKISAGRQHVLFVLSGFPVADRPARTRLMGIVSYCLERGVTVGLCGAEQTRWPLLKLDGKRQPQLFVTESEAIASLVAVPEAPGEAAAPVAATSPPDDTETQIRLRGVEDLMRTYESFQNTGELDPFGLERLGAIYRKDRSREALVELDKAIRDIPRRRQLLLKMAADAERLADEALEFTFHRKLPVTAAEGEAYSKGAEIERDAMGRERDQLNEDNALLEKKLETIQKAARDVEAKLAAKLQQAQTELEREKEATIQARDQANEQTQADEARIRELQSSLSAR